MVVIYMCPHCKVVLRTDNQFAMKNECERCGRSLIWVKDEDPEVVAEYIKIPVSAWDDLRDKV